MPYKFKPEIEALIALVNGYFPTPRNVRVLVDNPLAAIRSVVIYVRLSKADRKERKEKAKLSPKIQVDACARLAKAMKWNVVGVFDKDVGVSGKNFDRPDWERMIAYVKTSKVKVDAILVAKIDRFARSVEEGLATIRELAEVGIVLRTAETPYLAPETDIGWQSIVMGLVFAEMERRNTIARTKAVLREMKLSGVKLGKDSRFFTTDERGAILPTNTAVRIAEMRASGETYGAIARALSVKKGEVWDCCLFLSKLKAESEAQEEAELGAAVPVGGD